MIIYTPKQFKIACEKIGRLSKPSKMPCPSWSIPAKYCGIGSKLRKVAGSVCSFCYAMKGFYLWPVVEKAMERRWKILMQCFRNLTARDVFVTNFAYALNYLRTRKVGKQHAHFRWFDSGDLVSVEHLEMIYRIAALTPDVQHWLPTHEYGIVRNTHRSCPPNLCVRISAAMIDGSAPDLGLPVSLVHSHNTVPPGAYICPAPTQGGKCVDCRACWDRTVEVVSYVLH